MGVRKIRVATMLIEWLLERGMSETVPVEPIQAPKVCDLRMRDHCVELLVESTSFPSFEGAGETLETAREVLPAFRRSYAGVSLFLVGSGACVSRFDSPPGEEPWKVIAIVDTLPKAQELCAKPGDFYCPFTVGDPFPLTTRDAPGFTVPFGWLDVPFDLQADENPDAEVPGA